jgi:GT2 family glycosyltransferase
MDLNGLDEVNLAVAFNDVDFCLRARQAGWRVVYTPYAELYHHESATRGGKKTAESKARMRREAGYMRSQWGHLLTQDPFYSPNLSTARPDFSLSRAPMVKRPWRE